MFFKICPVGGEVHIPGEGFLLWLVCLKGSAAEIEGKVKFLCIAVCKFLLCSQLPSQLAHTKRMSGSFCDFTLGGRNNLENLGAGVLKVSYERGSF